jgi:Cellulase (glycosyl hydrolase family 5)/Domain of unknown function (DUF4114)
MPAANSKKNFQVIGTKIYDPSGKEFIIKGTNMFTWEGNTQVNSIVNQWQFNTVRVPNYLLGSYGQLSPQLDGYATNRAIADSFTSQGAVVIFDAHDRIGGYYEGQDWETLKNYWRNMAQQFKDNPYIWFNLHNEPGNNLAKPDKWVNYHRELINIIRAEGANNTIVIDGEAWGQDYDTQTIPNYAHQVMDKNQNIIFSIHAYDRWNGKDIGQYFDTLDVKDIPVIVGEYGFENAGQSTLDATNRAIAATQEREIGRIVWAYTTNGNQGLSSVSPQNFNGTNTEILTDLGNIVWQDLQRIEDLEDISKATPSNLNINYSSGVFEVGSTGKIEFNYLFDGGWYQGDLAIFNLDGMEKFQVGTQGFIQEAARRALTNSKLGYILSRDLNDGVLFNSKLAWEKDFNLGEYLGIKSFTMPRGDKFAFMLVPNTKVEEIANNPGKMWESGKLPLFSIPEANPGGQDAAQIVAVDNHGVYGMEDIRTDWGKSDRDYNDIVFQLKGAKGIVPSIDKNYNIQRNWRDTTTGQKLLNYANDSVFDEGVFVVGTTGQVTVDFLYDGGVYQGEVGIFSLAGLGSLNRNSVEFRQEAIKRALSNSGQGHIVLRDSIEDGRFISNPELTWEKNFNSETYQGSHQFSMKSGDVVALIFNPNGNIEELLGNTNKTPFFSMATANANNKIQLAEVKKLQQNSIVGWEDLSLSFGSDRDYNDIVMSLEGVRSIGVTDLSSVINLDRQWQNTTVGQNIINYFNDI